MRRLLLFLKIKVDVVHQVTLVLFLNMLIILPVLSQERIITGRVFSGDNDSELPGVTVKLEDKNIGTVTDINGEYSLSVPNDSEVLLFSFVGYDLARISIGNQSMINITLMPASKTLSEVVVTALGIERDAASLGYTVQKVSGESLNEARETNFVNGLAGKVAGLTVTSNAAVGSSSRVVIRGESSLNYFGNQPLYVVDGVPISNNVANTTGADYGHGSAEINPADVEEITVLKGPAAAALYGSRAANGVIMITTKSGKNAKGLGLTFNTSLTFEDVLILPKFQNEFGGGFAGQFEGSNFGARVNQDLFPNGIYDGDDESWGPRLDTGPYRAQFDSPTTNGYRGADVHIRDRGDIIPTPWRSQPNNVRDFFEIGRTTFNNVALTGSNDYADFRLSYTNLNQKGIVPNNDLQRNSLSLNAGYNISDKFRASTVINYIKTESSNRPDQGYGRNTPMYFMLWMTRQTNMNAMRNYWQPGLEGIQQFQYNYGENHNNPFFYQYENTSGQDKNRLFGNLSLTYDILPNLNLMVRTGLDYYNDFRPIRRAVSTVGALRGSYSEVNLIFEEQNTDFLLSYSPKISNDFGVTVSFGGNHMVQKNRSSNVTAPELLIPGIYNIGNTGAPLQAWGSRSEKQINSFYGIASFDFRNMLFLDLTARNDWSSTLPADNQSYFYPSATLSTVLNEIFELPAFIHHGKIRAGIAQVGNDTGPYQLNNTYNYQLPWGNTLILDESAQLKNPQLKPEITTSYEIGTDIGFFNNRISFDLTYYDIHSDNQILPLAISSTSGYSNRVINAGKVRNQGVELMMNLIPISLRNDFQWSVNINFAKNVSKVVELMDGMESFVQVAPGEEATIEARVGERTGAMYGPGYQRVPEGQPLAGQMIILPSGLPKVTEEFIYLGNVNPDWTAGIYNTLSFKGFYVGGLLDIRYGGIFLSRFYNKAVGAGQLLETAAGRSARAVGTEYDGLYYHEGAAELGPNEYTQNLTINDGTYSEGVYGTSVRNFHKVYTDHISESQIFDATYVKLRELKVGYNVPTSLIKNTPFRNVTISAVGRNLALWTKNIHFDPETGASTGGGLVPGFENMSLPSTKSYGFNLNISF